MGGVRTRGIGPGRFCYLVVLQDRCRGEIIEIEEVCFPPTPLFFFKVASLNMCMCFGREVGGWGGVL